MINEWRLMLWLSEQFLFGLSEICGMNFLFSVHSLWLFHCIIPFLHLSYFLVDQWFRNLTWYHILVHASNKPCPISIVHQKQPSFHIIPGIITLLPLDYVQKSLPRWRTLRKCICQGGKVWTDIWLRIGLFCTDFLQVPT